MKENYDSYEIFVGSDFKSVTMRVQDESAHGFHI